MRYHLTVKGHVQGVGYRYFVIGKAKQFHLTGWVRNCSNGNVKCEAQGDEPTVQEFIRHLQTGHLWARVRQVQQEPMAEIQDEKNFEIRY